MQVVKMVYAAFRLSILYSFIFLKQLKNIRRLPLNNQGFDFLQTRKSRSTFEKFQPCV